MDAIEQAIRNAFAKGSPEDPAFREKVYRSASAALEKALGSNAAITPEAAERRRKGLFATITSIESEFVPAVDPVAASSSLRTTPARDPVATPQSVAPEVSVSPLRDGGPPVFPDTATEVGQSSSDWPEPTMGEERPVLAGEPRPEPVLAREEQEPGRRRGRGIGLLAWLVLLVVSLGLAVWIGVEAGLVNLSGGSSTSETSDAVVVADESDGAPRKQGEQEALENWIVVFTPDDPTTVAAAVGAQAQVVDGDEKAIRIQSGESGAPVRFDVGQGVLDRIAGKAAVFNIIARTGDGPESQISVSCDFGSLGDCGRNRYIVGTQRAEFLLQVDIPDGTATGPGTIEIQADLDNAGKAVDIMLIRVNTP